MDTILTDKEVLIWAKATEKFRNTERVHRVNYEQALNQAEQIKDLSEYNHTVDVIQARYQHDIKAAEQEYDLVIGLIEGWKKIRAAAKQESKS